jgi:hypothetical protein
MLVVVSAGWVVVISSIGSITVRRPTRYKYSAHGYRVVRQCGVSRESFAATSVFEILSSDTGLVATLVLLVLSWNRASCGVRIGLGSICDGAVPQAGRSAEPLHL